MRTHELRKAILMAFSKNEFYGYNIHKKLKSMGLEIELSRLYRLLNEMMHEGLLEARWQKSSQGPGRKMYRLGAQGKEELDKILLDAINVVHEFYVSYILQVNPKLFIEVFQLLFKGMKKKNAIALLLAEESPMHEKAIDTINTIIPDSKIFLVKPPHLQVSLKKENLTLLDGTLSSIPLKDDHIDLLFSTSLPDKQSLELILKEWCRIIRPNGRLAIITPTILITENIEPLTMEQFIEKFEHKKIRDKEIIPKTLLLSKFAKYFTKIQDQNIMHATMLIFTKPNSRKDTKKFG